MVDYLNEFFKKLSQDDKAKILNKNVKYQNIYPIGAEKTYYNKLTKGIKYIVDNSIKWVKTYYNSLAYNYRIKTDTDYKDFYDFLDTLELDYNKELSSDTLRKVYNVTFAFNVENLNRYIKAKLGFTIIGLQVGWKDKLYDDFFYRNIELIKSLQSDVKKQVAMQIHNGIMEGKSVKTIIKELTDREHGVLIKSKKRASLIARDQIGKINGQIEQHLQEDAGFTYYVWRTSLDDRVRKTHREKEGIIFKWSNPPKDTGHPGYDYQCRCNAEPFFDWDVPSSINLEGLSEQEANAIVRRYAND